MTRKSTSHTLLGIDSRIWLIIALTIPVLILTAIEPPIAQDQSYHDFADQRAFFGIQNFFNVGSNFAFLIVGIIGMFFLSSQHQRHYAAFIDRREIIPYWVLFSGIAITSFGSAYYHISPNDTHLVLDRLPMTLTFMAFFAITIMERISLRTGLYLLVPLLLFGVFSVAFWYAGDLRGSGDLRLYVDVQFYPLLAMPLIVILFPPRYIPDRWIFGVILFYALSKACEIWDFQIYEAMHGYVSGHTLKHLIAAFASYLVVWVLKHREPVV